MNRIFFTLMILTFPYIIFPQPKNVSKVGITAAPFLEIGVGSRAIGMGGAFVATANDASALYWNPAGIATMRTGEVILMHAKWLADMPFDFAGVVIPLGSFGAIGAMITTLNSGDMKVRTIEQPEGTGELFSTNDLAIGLSYARSLTDRFSIGFNVKFINQRIWHESATGFAIDFGTLFVTGFKGLRIGAALSNFGTDMRMQGKDIQVFHDLDPTILGNNERIPAYLKTDSWPLPINFQFGLATEFWKTANNRLTLAIDALHPYDNTESLNIGGEYAFREMLFFRAGYQDLFLKEGEQSFTLGAGLANRLVGTVNVQFDYAYTDFGRLENTQRFSLTISF
ncbi:MAG: PorV/PorQ family protein [candidate division KSB1 bacterium]|nr:PorV/PorQ family protein [candidate division KSB1 bacterium]